MRIEILLPAGIAVALTLVSAFFFVRDARGTENGATLDALLVPCGTAPA